MELEISKRYSYSFHLISAMVEYRLLRFLAVG